MKNLTEATEATAATAATAATKTTRKIKTILSTFLAKRPSNAFLLFLTGFFFSQFMLVNILYTRDPLGGWVTSVGVISTPAILLAVLFALSLCLIALWKSAATEESSNETKVSETSVNSTASVSFLTPKSSMAKTQNNYSPIYSPIDYPRGTTRAVVSAYAMG